MCGLEISARPPCQAKQRGGASTPEMLVAQAVDALRGRGVSVREVHVVEEDVRFAIPQELERMAQERGMALPERTAMRQSI